MLLALLLASQLKVEMKAHESFYLAHVPTGYSDRRSWPVVVTLHREGDREEARRELAQWAELGEKGGYVVVAPQSRTKAWGAEKASSDGAFVRACLDDAKTRWRVDPERVLLSGLGRGADFLLGMGAGAFAGTAPFLPSSGGEAKKGPPCYLVAGADPEPAEKRAEAIRGHEGDVTLRKTSTAAGAFPAREEYERALAWFERKARPTADQARVDEYLKDSRYLDACLVLAGLLEQPEGAAQVRWQLNKIEGRGLIELSKVEIALSEKRYVDAYLRCREAAVQFSWVPVGEKARRRLAALESDDRVKKALEKND